MKILYAVQATGNGHISRAMELLPHFEKHGHVDIFLSGSNSSLQLDAPIKYRSKGLSLFYKCNGSLNMPKIITKLSPFSLRKEIKDLPVEKYDLVINDFEFITSQACKLKNIPSVHFGHQASFLSSKTPRPNKKNILGEFVLKNYAKAAVNIGLHFKQYDDFITTPIIKEEILKALPKDGGYYIVYLPSYCDDILENYFLKLKDFKFQIFSFQKKNKVYKQNITYIPIDKSSFNTSLINCTGIITGAGFETPAEAIYLQKKIIAIPIKGQYEQQCNAAALKQMGITTLKNFDDNFERIFTEWINKPAIINTEKYCSTYSIIEKVMCSGLASKTPNQELIELELPDFSFC